MEAEELQLIRNLKSLAGILKDEAEQVLVMLSEIIDERQAEQMSAADVHLRILSVGEVAAKFIGKIKKGLEIGKPKPSLYMWR